MEYDPFIRGRFPVGVRSWDAIDTARNNRRLTVEVWYPASPRYFALDLNPATQDAFTVVPRSLPIRQAAVRDVPADGGAYPLLLFSHNSLGHRRQSTFLCTHLASHGYIVAAVDHAGNSFGDWVELALTGATFGDAERDAYIERITADRVPDLRFLLDEMLDGAAHEFSGRVDDARIGLIGWSLGGWAVLSMLDVDDRPGAVVALAPAGSSNPVPGVIPVTLDFQWKRPVPALYLAAGRDRYTPVPGITELFERTPAEAWMLVLRHADHDHFGDHIEAPLCPEQHARLFTRGLTLAHLEATLSGNEAARRFMAGDPAAVLREHGIDAAAVPRGTVGTSST